MKVLGTLLLIGANSDIGRAIADRFAREGWRLVVTARTADVVAREAADLQVRHGRPVGTAVLDVTDTAGVVQMAKDLDVVPDVVVCVAGMLGDPDMADHDPAHLTDVLRTNFEGPAVALGHFGQLMAARGSGVLIGVSSVAGDRGRASNPAYGSAKAGLSSYLSGLRQRLFSKGVRVMTVKPGYVRTTMTAGMQLPGPITASPGQVAETVYRAFINGADVVYALWMWRYIMLIIRHIPEPIFKRLKGL